MKPKKPLPTERPFLTILTRTYRRPAGLVALMRTIQRQTLAHSIEHIIIPDYIGVAPNDAVYGVLPMYTSAIHGEYVHVLGDDDILKSEFSVEHLRDDIREAGNPVYQVVNCYKGEQTYPKAWPPKEGDIDLCNLVIRADVFEAMMSRYAKGYKCDWGAFNVLTEIAGLQPLSALIYATGRVGGGRPEAVDW